MNKIIMLSSVLLFCLTSHAQTTDSIGKETTEFIIDKIPSTRTLDLQIEKFGSRHFDSKLFGGNFKTAK